MGEWRLLVGVTLLAIAAELSESYFQMLAKFDDKPVSVYQLQFISCNCPGPCVAQTPNSTCTGRLTAGDDNEYNASYCVFTSDGQDSIRFEVKVATTTWVGIGFSDTASMVNTCSIAVNFEVFAVVFQAGKLNPRK